MLSFESRETRTVRPWIFKLIWGGVFLTFLQYGVIIHLALKNEGAPAENAKSITLIFGVIGIIAMIIGVCMKKYFFSQGWARRFLEKQEQIADGHVPGMPPDEKTIARLLQITFPLYLACLGMVHTSAVFGLVATLLSRNASTFLPFIAITVTGTLLCYPNIKEFIEDIRLA